jgi:hypothetical protein
MFRILRKILVALSMMHTRTMCYKVREKNHSAQQILGKTLTATVRCKPVSTLSIPTSSIIDVEDDEHPLGQRGGAGERAFVLGAGDVQ